MFLPAERIGLLRGNRPFSAKMQSRSPGSSIQSLRKRKDGQNKQNEPKRFGSFIIYTFLGKLIKKRGDNMIRKKTLWLILAIGITAIIAAFLLLYNSAEEQTHDGASFVLAGELF